MAHVSTFLVVWNSLSFQLAHQARPRRRSSNSMPSVSQYNLLNKQAVLLGREGGPHIPCHTCDGYATQEMLSVVQVSKVTSSPLLHDIFRLLMQSSFFYNQLNTCRPKMTFNHPHTDQHCKTILNEIKQTETIDHWQLTLFEIYAIPPLIKKKKKT